MMSIGLGLAILRRAGWLNHRYGALLCLFQSSVGLFGYQRDISPRRFKFGPLMRSTDLTIIAAENTRTILRAAKIVSTNQPMVGSCGEVFSFTVKCFSSGKASNNDPSTGPRRLTRQTIPRRR